MSGKQHLLLQVLDRQQAGHLQVIISVALHNKADF